MNTPLGKTNLINPSIDFMMSSDEVNESAPVNGNPI